MSYLLFERYIEFGSDARLAFHINNAIQQVNIVFHDMQTKTSTRNVAGIRCPEKSLEQMFLIRLRYSNARVFD